MIKAEWKAILTNRKLLIPIIAVLFIPVLYAGMFLWAFWDPYASLSDLPVAIVNSDEGAQMDGLELKLGETLQDKLMDSEQFNFISVSEKDAQQGLEDQDYYLLIEIPENFSQHATTLLDEQPEKMVITYKANEGYNFLASQIGGTAMDRIRAEVNKEVTSTYAEQLFDSITKIGDGFAEASDGAGQLKDGASEIDNGASDLKGYLEQLASSTIELQDGTDTVVNGIQSAAKGSTQLNDGIAKLADGSTQLADGASQTATGAGSLKEGISDYTAGVAKLNESYQLLSEKEKALVESLAKLQSSSATLNDSANQLSQGASQVTTGIKALASQMEQISATLPAEQAAALTETLKQLENGSSSVSAGLDKLAGGTNALADGTAQVHNGAAQLSAGYTQAGQGVAKLNESSAALVEGSSSLATGTNTLAAKMKEFNTGIGQAYTGSTNLVSGLNQLANGSTQLQKGTGTLAEKSGELAVGSTKLADGTKALVDGTDTLKTRLQDASKEVGDVSANDDTFDMISSPVDVDTEAVNAVPNYGTGFTPYFLSLGLFVGALLISIVFPLVQPAIKPTNGAAWFTSKVTVLGVVGIIQSLIVVAIALFALKLETQNVGMFILTAIITSFTFLALIQLFVSVLSDSGRFLAILVLILQLTTSAGTFPLELIPQPLQIFNKLLPMTYSVQAFKAAISTGNMSNLWASNGVLIGFMVVCLVLTFGYFMLIFKKRHSKQTAEA
ncbi:YhgE/Pip domain-containing protein [Psychrobacillus sp. NEAU-3TGS]|uniref:YhgE/Pip domain-containing protein n=1 Tax=Psychrobacillus sp. NEAU-3TGS TaxID=2995412 RepID=UPI002499792E|nr:YhgE/Pip domain-containing protein [Psychrobacillus sp. NEAU-3TGS]MDI2586725.1 YhgE/Pip domain-containing protein [Psychrobacillus sp. NEAU-3TGS]